QGDSRESKRHDKAIPPPQAPRPERGSSFRIRAVCSLQEQQRELSGRRTMTRAVVETRLGPQRTEEVAALVVHRVAEPGRKQFVGIRALLRAQQEAQSECQLVDVARRRRLQTCF